MILNFPDSRTVRRKCLLFKLPSLGCSVIAAQTGKTRGPSNTPGGTICVVGVFFSNHSLRDRHERAGIKVSSSTKHFQAWCPPPPSLATSPQPPSPPPPQAKPWCIFVQGCLSLGAPLCLALHFIVSDPLTNPERVIIIPSLQIRNQNLSRASTQDLPAQKPLHWGLASSPWPARSCLSLSCTSGQSLVSFQMVSWASNY